MRSVTQSLKQMARHSGFGLGSLLLENFAAQEQPHLGSILFWLSTLLLEEKCGWETVNEGVPAGEAAIESRLQPMALLVGRAVDGVLRALCRGQHPLVLPSQ